MDGDSNFLKENNAKHMWHPMAHPAEMRAKPPRIITSAEGVTITDIDGTADHFTRIYGRETGKRAPDGTHVVRPGFDSNIATDNRLKPNERERYYVTYDVSDVAQTSIGILSFASASPTFAMNPTPPKIAGFSKLNRVLFLSMTIPFIPSSG